MKRLLIIAVLLAASAFFSACTETANKATSSPAPSAAAAAAAPASTASVVQEVTRLETVEWVQADLKKDIAWYEKHFADDYMSTSGRTGKVMNKAEDIASSKDPAFAIEAETVEDFKVHALENAAVATGQVNVKGKDKNGPFDRHARFTDVWAKRDGKWVVVVTHGSDIPVAKK